ncbi:SdpI family protein [Caldalkalibacillus mannanilyticus]|uniref:SdpI family protein n=1 Tax=Caldalkalibacillus mannanilyticus TaxID=1418 RepID=UPI000683F862|nr:SdpI family protein [Caldalkalibacillus mannanilyticus]
MMENLLIGGILFLAGLILRIFPPRRINHLYGYRTRRARRNIENWTLANRYSSKLLMIIGLILLLVAWVTESTLVTSILAGILILILFVLVEFKLD